VSWRDDPAALLAIYNGLLLAHGLPERRITQSSSAKIRSGLRKLRAWCVENGADPERYMYARHQAIGWSRRLSLEQLAKPPALFLERYQDWGDDWAAYSLGQESARAQVEDDTPRDGTTLIVLWERMKAIYALDKELCMAVEVTGGYNAQSPWCQACAVAAECGGRRGRS
jgi:hypothetical protein